MRAAGHSVYDKFADYVDMADFEKWTTRRDPLKRLDEALVEFGVMTQEEIAASHERARSDAEQAREEALEGPMPDPASLTEGVFAE